MRVLLFGIAVVPVLLGIFFKYIDYQCEHFPLDYSEAAGKVILITGANSGLGYDTALALAKVDAVVALACRSESRCNTAKKSILAEYPQGKVETYSLDLSSFVSIRSFVKTFLTKHATFDVLINNAGIMALPERGTTQDGLELQVGTNHFGPYLLTALLFPSLRKNGRIVNHSGSIYILAHAEFPFKNLQAEESYSPWEVYCNSKIANLFFTFQLNTRLREAGNPRNISVIAVHPGYSATNLQTGRFPLADYANALVAMKSAHGALSQIYAAVDPHASSSINSYIGPHLVTVGTPAVQATNAASQETSKHQKLWEESVRITGEDFDFSL
eukprot:gene6868-7590_t